MIELETILLLVIGVFLGSIIGTEYASWRMGRRIRKWAYQILNISDFQWKACGNEATKRALISGKLRELGETVFPLPNIPRPPLEKVKTLKEKED